MRKYAVDLNTEDVIIDKKSGRVVIVDDIEPLVKQEDKFIVRAYFEDNGEDWTRTLDHDSVIMVQ